MQYAVIGTGWIAASYIQGAAKTGNWELAAVYSRTEEKGQAFAEPFGVHQIFTDIKKLAESDIPAVYIASPNALHYKQTRLLLEAGKHVICEKPACVTPKGMAELQKIADQNGVIYLEAIMLLHQPHRKIMEDAMKRLGRITSARLDFSQLSSKYPAYLRGELPNIFNPEMAAGSLMDLGVYCVYPALTWFGTPEKITASASFLPTGADESCAAILTYPDKLVLLNCSKTGQSSLGSEIIGDEGTLTIQSISKLTGVSFRNKSGEEQLLISDIEKETLMGNEAADFARYIAEKGHSPEYRRCQQLALDTSRTMEEIRRLAGIHFKEEIV